MSKPRRRHTAEQKAELLRQHVAEKKPVSEVCNEAEIQPSLFYTWQRELLAGAHTVFSTRRAPSRENELEAKISRLEAALLHGPEQIADLPVPVAESPGAVRIGHPERSHLVEYLAPNSVFNSLPRQRSSPHLRPDDRLVTIDRVLHHASLGVA